uniref:Retrotransposon gag domain-containing protein n=2 Tax=Nicotiana TaxID=4085 RepID=A0A1S4DH52_TOBAC|nr:PREDICTED: uncharacterized protein LOC104247599 [Nicotiana sylvestris]XP_016512681.1 PREDICTED: uncharacterized protein LOC107829729 [Nicotiana tabacum]
MRRNPVPPPIVQDEDMDMRSAVQLLTKLVASQDQRQVDTRVGHINKVISARVRDFINLDSPVFTESNKDEDPGTNASPAVWEEFSGAFLRHYMLAEIHQARVERFLTVKQGNMSVREYSLQFDSFGEGSRIFGFHNQRDSAQMRAPPLRCSQCGRAHSGQCHQGSNAFYTYGYPSHYIRDCPINGRSGMVHPTRSITVSSSLVRPQERGPHASAGRGRGRGGASSSGGSQNRIYALAGRQDPEATPDDVLGIVIIGNVRFY